MTILLHPILSYKIRHVLFWSRKSANFLYIGQQIAFMTSW